MTDATSARRRAILAMLLAAVLWSLGGILIKWVQWNPMAISGMRSAIAALFLLVVLRRPRFTWSPAQLGCAVAYAGTVILFVVANKWTTAANAILLQYTGPIWVALFGGWFLGERATWIDWAAIALVIGGMSLFFLESLGGGGLSGDIVAVLSGVCFGSLALFMRKQRGGSPVESIILGNALAALAGLPFMFDALPDASSWGGLLLLGIVQLGVPYWLYSVAIHHITALEAILIPVIEPLLNPLWVLLLLGEAPGPLALVGGAVVLGAVTGRGALVARRQRAGPPVR
jgi:drug/metabolite transporter (DMT)-like permease